MPLGDGNNMFISVSAEGDLECAPPGRRAVMVSTHGELAPWRNLTPEQYQRKKEEMGERLIGFARREKAHEAWRAELKEGLEKYSRSKNADPAVWSEFSAHVLYCQGEFGDPGAYKKLNDS